MAISKNAGPGLGRGLTAELEASGSETAQAKIMQGLIALEVGATRAT